MEEHTHEWPGAAEEEYKRQGAAEDHKCEACSVEEEHKHKSRHTKDDHEPER